MSNPRKLLTITIVLLATLSFAVSAAAARDGDPDPSFGGDGRVVASGGWAPFEQAEAMTVDPQGRILVVSAGGRAITRPVVFRFNPDGSLDQSFGGRGIVAVESLVGGWFPSVAVDAAGRIVLAGRLVQFGVSEDVAIARLLDNGQLDPSFGEGGKMTAAIGESEDRGYDLTFDGQGRILVTGTARLGGQVRMVVLRATEAGVLDPTFDEDGIAYGDFQEGEFSDETSAGRAITVDPSGRILAAGTATVHGNPQFAIAGLDTLGHPDPTIGGDGTATVDLSLWPLEEVANDIALDAQNRIVLAGNDGRGFALTARLLPDGSPDPSFAGDGRLVLPLPGVAIAAGVAVDGSNRVLVVGSLTQGEIGNAFLARLNQDGSFDGSFGAGGLVREDFLVGNGNGVDLAIDSVGRYLITGRASGPNEAGGTGVARYLNGEVQPQPVLKCRGKRATVVGTGKRDRLRGTGRRDVIVALGGNDRIRSLGGRDLICAGAGRDLVRAGAGNDTVFGGRGDDRLFGQAGRDRLRGGPGKDRLFGGAGRDSLRSRNVTP